MQSVTIGVNQAGQRLDKFLRKTLPQAGTGVLYKMLRKKNITLNGKKAEGSEMLAVGDQVCFFFSRETFENFSGQGVSHSGHADIADQGRSGPAQYLQARRSLRGIRVVYEDDHVLILDKPAGVLTQKAKADDLSLNEWMIGYLLERDPGFERELKNFRPSVCNRLDRNTSGLVLCGKSLPGLQYLSRCIRDRSIRKYYHTICVGQIRDEALVKGYLAKDEAKNRVYVLPHRPDNLSHKAAGGSFIKTASGLVGDYIETAYRPLRAGKSYTLLEVELITGKPHQIRAHLASQGHPLIGDFKYGDQQINKMMQSEYGLQHQLLHAFQVIFPETDEPAGAALSGMSITAPWPELFQHISETLDLSDWYRHNGNNKRG